MYMQRSKASVVSAWPSDLSSLLSLPRARASADSPQPRPEFSSVAWTKQVGQTATSVCNLRDTHVPKKEHEGGQEAAEVVVPVYVASFI